MRAFCRGLKNTIKNANFETGALFFWLALSIYLAEESYRLDLGTLNQPGSGFFPFLASATLFFLSLILLVQSASKKPGKKPDKARTSYRNIILCLACLYVYAWIFDWLGFVPSTFLFIVLLIKFIGNKGWTSAILTGALTAILSYIFFGLWLQAALPQGIFRI